VGEKQETVSIAATADVLAEEYRRLWPDDKAPPAEEAAYRKKAFANGQAALCLSGGGIRSAAFALGVLQALSQKQLLTGFHYLSTVSGGGYIGSWLQRWIGEDGDAGRVMTKLADVKEPAEVSALRENSNFITPRIGFASNDTWTAVAISARNIALNWLLFAPLLLGITVLPNLFEASVRSLPVRSVRDPWLAYVPLILSALFAWLAAWSVCRGLPSYRASTTVTPANADGWLTKRIVLPLVLWSISGTLSVAIDVFHDSNVGIAGGELTLVSLTATLLGLLASGATLPDPHNAGHADTFRRDLPVWIIALLFAAAVTLVGAGLFAGWVEHGLPDKFAHARFADNSSRFAAMLGYWEDRKVLSAVAVLTLMGPLWLMSTQLLIAVVFAGFRDARGPTVQPDGDREWLARLSAVKIKPMLLWAMMGFAVLILDWTLRQFVPGYDMSLSGFVALASGLVAVGGGKSAKSGSSTSTIKGIAATVLKRLPLGGVIAVATAVFVFMLFLIFGRIERDAAAALAHRLGEGWPGWVPAAIGHWHWASWVDPQVVAHFVLLFLVGALLLFFRGKVQVNRFSLNGLYRNRLARAFLGGARQDRKPDPFTGFDPGDNVRMHSLAPKAGKAACLYPVVNVALNVTATEKLAWQERKAEPFVFTPAYSGSAMLRPPGWSPPPGGDASEAPGAYIDSKVYGGSEPDLAMKDFGVSLATAVSISGAAASPNMGYHTSAATALLMTLFNVRLGAWLPNPAQAVQMGERIKLSGPDDSLRAILRELGGATDDQGWDIYLSDGGHFENLGLYEMVRRRCRYIFVSDAGADPNCSFEDLGNAIRKVKIDLDVDISFKKMRISSRHSPIDPQYAYALGTILYPEARDVAQAKLEKGIAAPPKTGRIIYVKPSFFGDLPIDVRSYAATSEAFPHESTADQFFSESQFESYRRLGYFFTSELGGDGPAAGIEAFFDAVDVQYAAAFAPPRSGEAGDGAKVGGRGAAG
jgi:hypothetical protein